MLIYGNSLLWWIINLIQKELFYHNLRARALNYIILYPSFLIMKKKLLLLIISAIQLLIPKLVSTPVSSLQNSHQCRIIQTFESSFDQHTFIQEHYFSFAKIFSNDEANKFHKGIPQSTIRSFCI